MAAGNLLALIDDIATVLDDIAVLAKVAGRKTAGVMDDVAVLTKVAGKKTAGVLGDDLALNAQQVAGVRAERELPVVWAVAKGSMLNKAILVPLALAIGFYLPWAVTPLLMIGGAFLCFEGCEKLAHRLLHDEDEDAAAHAQHLRAAAGEGVDLVALERDKIKGAIRTDFILSAEIIAITLGTVAHAPFLTQVLVLCGMAMLMTVGVYGFVAAIVKLDDGGLHLSRVAGATPFARAQRAIGAGILVAAPWMMKALSVAGTAAMFLVGGGILVHGVPALHHGIEGLAHALVVVPVVGPLAEGLAAALLNAIAGIVAGGIVLALVTGIKRLRAPRPAPK